MIVSALKRSYATIETTLTVRPERVSKESCLFLPWEAKKRLCHRGASSRLNSLSGEQKNMSSVWSGVIPTELGGENNLGPRLYIAEKRFLSPLKI